MNFTYIVYIQTLYMFIYTPGATSGLLGPPHPGVEAADAGPARSRKGHGRGEADAAAAAGDGQAAADTVLEAPAAHQEEQRQY